MVSRLHNVGSNLFLNIKLSIADTRHAVHCVCVCLHRVIHPSLRSVLMCALSKVENSSIKLKRRENRHEQNTQN